MRTGPPILGPQQIVCLGLNYSDHAAEAGLEPPKSPMWFAKFAYSLARATDPIVPPTSTNQVDYEAELAVIIGTRGRNIAVEDALKHVAGAMAFNDVSARDLQMANPLWTGGKAIDTFAPCGLALVLLDEIDDLESLGVRTRVNGETRQDGNTRSMIFGVAETIAFLSKVMTLEPGDIIATGTPPGVGHARTPRVFSHPGRRRRGGDRGDRHVAQPGRRRGLKRGENHGTQLDPEPEAAPRQLQDRSRRRDDRVVPTVVGTTVTHRFEGGAWLTNDAANHRIALLTVPGLFDDPDKIAQACTTAPTSTARWTGFSTPTSGSRARTSSRTRASTTA